MAYTIRNCTGHKTRLARLTALDELRLELRINATPNFTAIVTGHGNIKTYLYKYKIIVSPMCSCEEGEQSVDHILHECKLLAHDRDRLKATVMRSENWPVSKDNLSIKASKNSRTTYY